MRQVGSVTISTITQSSLDQRKSGVSATTSNEAVATYCERNSIERKLFDRSKEDRMSSGMDECKLKGGHPPAVKAGGMRITQHKTPKDEREIKPSKDVEESRPSSSPPKTIMISGVPAKGNADFPPEALQHFHEKPTPTHDARLAHYSRPIIIQQPRK
ncbi:Death-associated protein 1 [Formica fusca]